MSEENVEVFRRGLEAYNRRDVDSFLAVFDPKVEIHPLTLAMFGREGTVYRGREGIRQFLRDVDEVLPGIQVEPLDFRDLGERLVATGRLHARGRASGAEVDSPIGWVVEFRQGKVIRMTDYLDPKEALEAATQREATSTLSPEGARRAARLAATSTLSAKGAEELIREQERTETRKP